MRAATFLAVALLGGSHGWLPGNAGEQMPAVAPLLAEANRLRLAMKFDEARARADQAARLAEWAGDKAGLALSHQAKGRIYSSSDKLDDAERMLETAQSEFESLGNHAGLALVMADLVDNFAMRGQWDRADAVGAEARRLFAELGDEVGGARLDLRLLKSDSRSPDDRRRAESALVVATRHEDLELRAHALKVLGMLSFVERDYASSLKTLAEVLELERKLGDVAGIAVSHITIGRIHAAHNDFARALGECQRAVDLLAPTGERFTYVNAINYTSIALWNLGRRAEALAAVERGLILARESANPVLIDFTLGTLAGLLTHGEDYARAAPILEEVLRRKPPPLTAALRHAQLSEALRRLGRAGQALPHANESVRISRELNELEQIDVRLTERARVLAALGRFEEALIDARDAVFVIDQLRMKLLPSDFLKRGYGVRTEYAFANVINLLSKLGRRSESLEFAEKGRARAFLDLLASRSAAAAGNAIAGPGSEAMGRPSNVEEIREIAARLNSTLVSFWVADEATMIWVLRPAAEPAHIRVPITSKRLTELVAATTAALRGTPKPADARGIGEASPAPIDAVEDLTSLPMRGLGLLALSRDDKSAWRELYKTLIEPVRSQLPGRGGRLVLVPHGPLFQLSFAGLQSRTGRYLIEDYELNYAPSASALAFTERRQRAAATNRDGAWVIVGSPSILPAVNARPLPPLPGAAREIASIAAIAPKGKGLRINGAAADESAVSHTLASANPSVLHFATHGFVFDDPEQPPFLALNQRGSAAADDGRLTLDEVYGLRLSTDLVVLSACRTGSGRVSSDGVLGLTRGFFYAGSPSVLATFWDVVDEVTVGLMSGFYRRYVKTHAKGASLRQAQLALLADLRAGKVSITAGGRKVPLPEHPLLWAAFFLSGEP